MFGRLISNVRADMKIIRILLLNLILVVIAGCSNYVPTEEDFHTNYIPDGIYILQQDVVMKGDGFLKFPSINNPQYWLTDDLYITDIPRIPKGSRIQYKKILFEDHIKLGPQFDPVGYLLDPPHEGKAVTLTFISQDEEIVENKFAAHGKYVNSDFLVLNKDK